MQEGVVVAVADGSDAKRSWRARHQDSARPGIEQREVEQLAWDVAAGRKLGNSVYANVALAKGGFASKVVYTFKIQAPSAQVRDDVFDKLQGTLNRLVFGGFRHIAVDMAQQPHCDGGVGHIDIAKRMRAEWAHLASQLANDVSAGWKNIWWWRLRQVYGELCDRDLLLSTCQYKLFEREQQPSQVQQAAMAAWAAVKTTPTQLVMPEMTPRRERRIELAQYDREEPPRAQPVWLHGMRELPGAFVGEQRLWFNCALAEQSDSRLYALSTVDTEREAIKWAEAGVVRVRDVLTGARIQSHVVFRGKHPDLDHTLMHAVRGGLPQQWVTALRDGSVVPTDERCLPLGLLDQLRPHQERRNMGASLHNICFA